MASGSLWDLYTSNGSRPLVIVTDVEPDDLIALWLLFSRVGCYQGAVCIIISAWKDQRPRAIFVEHFLNTYFPGLQFQVMLGCASSTRYKLPESLYVPYSGKETRCYPNWREGPQLSPNACYLQLAPVQELFELYTETPDFFRNATLAMYGSFNIRASPHPKHHLEQWISSFSKVFIYESFPATAPTIISDMPELRQKVPEVKIMIEWWNQTMLAKGCGAAITASIEASPHQFVNADTGLVGSLFLPMDQIPHLVTGRLSLPEVGYTKIEDLQPAKGHESFLTVWSADPDVKADYHTRLLQLF